MKASLAEMTATLFFIGHIPVAPGTFGTLAAFLFLLAVKPDTTQLVVLIIASFLAGLASAGRAEALSGEKDPGRIVIDEFVGYLVSVAFLPVTLSYQIAAFFLFRLFDILKPPPIRTIEKALTGSPAIMLDDVLAGLCANLLLQAWRLI